MSKVVEGSVSSEIVKLNVKATLLKGALVVLIAGLFITVTLLSANSFLEPYTNDDVYSFIASHVFIALSGVLYGLTLLLYQSDSLSIFISKFKTYAKPFLLTFVFVQFFILIGYVFAIVPGILLTVVFLFYPFVVIVEDRQTLGALKRSWQLFKRVWLQLFLYVIGFYLLFVVLAGLILLSFPMRSVFAEIIGGTIVFPLEAYMYYRLFQRALTREKVKKRDNND